MACNDDSKAGSPPKRQPEWVYWIRIIGSICGVIGNPIGFFLLGTWQGNYNAGVACLVHATMASQSLSHHVQFKRNRYFESFGPRTRSFMMYYEIALGTIGLILAITMFSYAAANQIPFTPISGSYLMAGIQWILLFQEAFFFVTSQREYIRYLNAKEEYDRTQVGPTSSRTNLDGSNDFA